MCGRIVLVSSPRVLAETFDAPMVPDLTPRYNIAPGTPLAAVLPGADRPGRLVRLLDWGFVPAWSRDPRAGPRPINARAETVAASPAFRDAFARRRCLIPADGFYEWQRQEGGKQPYLFRRRDGRIMALAGFWERWEKDGAQPLQTCAIVTTRADELMSPIHDRMPVILPPEAWEDWLRLPPERALELLALLVPGPAGELTAYPVTPRVNRPAFDEPACLEQEPQVPGQLGLFGDQPPASERKGRKP